MKKILREFIRESLSLRLLKEDVDSSNITTPHVEDARDFIGSITNGEKLTRWLGTIGDPVSLGLFLQKLKGAANVDTATNDDGKDYSQEYPIATAAYIVAMADADNMSVLQAWESTLSDVSEALSSVLNEAIVSRIVGGAIDSAAVDISEDAIKSSVREAVEAAIREYTEEGIKAALSAGTKIAKKDVKQIVLDNAKKIVKFELDSGIVSKLGLKSSDSHSLAAIEIAFKKYNRETVPGGDFFSNAIENKIIKPARQAAETAVDAELDALKAGVSAIASGGAIAAGAAAGRGLLTGGASWVRGVWSTPRLARALGYSAAPPLVTWAGLEMFGEEIPNTAGTRAAISADVNEFTTKIQGKLTESCNTLVSQLPKKPYGGKYPGLDAAVQEARAALGDLATGTPGAIDTLKRMGI